MSRVKYFLLAPLFSFLMNSCGFSEKQDYAENLIEQIEAFRVQESRLPINVSELGLVESPENLAFYQKDSDTSYRVWYGLSLGESMTYTSSDKAWNNP